MSIRSWPLIALLGASLVAACGDDDDDLNVDNGGSAGTSHAGTTSGGTHSQGGNNGQGGKTSEGGTAGSQNTAGRPSAGTSTGGTLAIGGAEQGGAGGAEQGGAEQGGMGGAGGDSAGGAGGASAVAALSDAQILLVLDTLNQGEVEEAYAALPRLMSAPVKTFAQRMVTDHSGARQSVLATADALSVAPTPSETQAELQDESQTHVALLRATPASSLDASYINMEAQEHAAALTLLDELALAADAAQLKTLIATLRATVLQHYQDAQALQATL